MVDADDGGVRVVPSPSYKDALRAWMVEHGFLALIPALTDVLRVECVADLALVTEADLPALGMKPIQARRFGRLPATVGNVLHLPPAPGIHKARGDLPPVVAISEDSAVAHSSVCGPRDDATFVVRSHQVAASLQRTGQNRQAIPLQWRGRAIDNDSDWSDGEDDVRSEGPKAKRRKTTQLSLKQRFYAGEAESQGSARVRLPTKHRNGVLKTSDLATAASGVGQANSVMGRAGKCDCREVLTSYEARFVIAKRTARERRLMRAGQE